MTDRTVHSSWVRITHWINATAVPLMVMSGWKIYDASPVFPFWRFPSAVTLGSWLGGALLWHFAVMWVVTANYATYLVLNIGSGRMRTRLLSISFEALASDLSAALRGTLKHEETSRYNALQKAAYLFAVACVASLIVSGVAIWKSVQFPVLRVLMGGYDSARVVRFGAMSSLLVFMVIHVVMVALFPRSLLSMLWEQ